MVQTARNGHGGHGIALAPYLLNLVGEKVSKYGEKGRRSPRIAKPPYLLNLDDEQVWRRAVWFFGLRGQAVGFPRRVWYDWPRGEAKER